MQMLLFTVIYFSRPQSGFGAAVLEKTIAPEGSDDNQYTDFSFENGYRIQRHSSGACRLVQQNGKYVTDGSESHCRAKAIAQAAQPHFNRLTVLIHGALRSSKRMEPIGIHLANHGIRSIGFDYASRRITVSEAAKSFREFCRGLPADEIHVVCHSMGGLVVREAIRQDRNLDKKITRHVFIGVPHSGSVLADKYASRKWFQLLFGPAGQDLRTQSIASGLPKPSGRYINIYGGRGKRGFRFSEIEGDDDGVVSAKSAILDGAEATYRVKAIHSSLVKKQESLNVISSFLR